MKLTPVSWKEFIHRLKSLGFEGPYYGGKHPKMRRGDNALIVPNQHIGTIGPGFLGRLLKQAGINKEEWGA